MWADASVTKMCNAAEVADFDSCSLESTVSLNVHRLTGNATNKWWRFMVVVVVDHWLIDCSWRC